ncbi:MAG: energy-coupling factor transporter ATPase [Eubacteriales bacterium]|nr:energy-coupling factor transporter ATPase [Eubacteriales bacterium]
MPIIEVRDVNFKYEDTTEYVIEHLNLEIEQGSFVCILGHNGSGKSTLAKLLNVLYTPTSGNIVICGKNVLNEENWKIRKHAGMVFQNPDNQLIATMVREDVAFGLENIGTPHDEMESIIDSSLVNVGMLEFGDRAPHLLSGGQKQRVAIAGILAMLPEVIIFDESTSMLDPQGRKEILNVVKRINKEKNITIIWITHFMEEAVEADRVVVFQHGKVAMDGKPLEVFSNEEEVKSLGLDIPPMIALTNALNKEGISISTQILTVDDMVKEITNKYANNHK